MNAPLTRLKTLTAAAAMLSLGAFAAPAANAALAPATTDCAPQTLVQPFSAFGDNNNYRLMPGGSFEDGLSWDTTGDAALSSDGYEGSSLYLPKGATATSPAMCISENDPTLRWFARESSAKDGKLRVEAIMVDAHGHELSPTVNEDNGKDNVDWVPSKAAPVKAELRLKPGQTTDVRFRFTARDGNWNIDDAYVDPYARW